MFVNMSSRSMVHLFNTAYYWAWDDNNWQLLFPAYSSEFAFTIYNFLVISTSMNYYRSLYIIFREGVF